MAVSTKKQVVADGGGDDAGVGAVEADAGGEVAGDGLAGNEVVAGPALADVVEEGGDEEEVGAAYAAGQGGGAYRILGTRSTVYSAPR
ncbi:hypothetical protein SALBM135S_07420 [Streptomyces alboniger]